MTPAEQSEREQVAYVLDALLAITAVALNAERVVQAEEVQRAQQRWKTRSERDEQGRWARVNKASEALRRVA
jgi:hypothetical protein